MTVTLRAGSLFSGYGGLDMGVVAALAQFGIKLETAWFCEYDEAPSRILAHHWPDIPNLGDITKVDWELVRLRTPFKRRDDRAKAMYDRYENGLSLAQVAQEFGCTRQNVYDVFRWREWPLRPKPSARPTVEWNGSKWSLRDNGYYGRTTGDRGMMHRAVWEHHNGPIPDGWDVHHIDRDRTNNSITNLMCLPKDEHTKLHAAEAAEEVMPKEAPVVDVLTGGFP